MKSSEINFNRMYGDLAYLWPLISPPEDYAEEAACWRDALRSKLGPGRHAILELGAGGGHNLSHLAGDFQAAAVDLSEGMLAHSMKLNPGVEHHLGDMRSIRLGRKFKAVIIHDAVDYMLTEGDLRAAFTTAAGHLEPGGVFITSPDYFRETFRDPHLEWYTNSDGEIELTLVEYNYDPDPQDTTVESIFVYLIREGGQLRIETDRHVTGLFPQQTWINLMESACFAVEVYPCQHQDGDPRQGVLLVGTLQLDERS